ncbi:UNVERIFIED_CONTAM: hypothetical protein K2H54_031779 [Gekko kuhli]
MGRRQEEERQRNPTSRGSWPAALLAAAVLSSGFRLAPAQLIRVTAEPPQPLEGEGVTLSPGRELTFLLCNWFRGEVAEANRIFTYLSSLSPPVQQNGPRFTGRETGGPGCSLHIGSLTLNDTGDYTVTGVETRGPETGRMYIRVSEKPVLRPAELCVEEHANVTLSCTTSRRSRVAIHWFKDGKAVPAKAALSERNRALTVPDVGRDDEGTYTCEARSRVYSAMSNPSKIAVTRAQSLKNKSSKQMNPIYENTGPSAQVVPMNPSAVDNTYEELQHGSRDVYDQLRW